MSVILSMAIFSISMSISPGPVNIMALSSGLNHGFAKTFSFVTGATIGFVSLLLLIGVGLGSLNAEYPPVLSILKYIGCIYVFYIGLKVFNTKGLINSCDRKDETLPTFTQGWLMQWLNPKAWGACFAGCSLFEVYFSSERLLLFLIIYFTLCYFGIAAWALLGDKVQLWINSEMKVKIFNRIMGSLLFGLSGVIFFA
ncbi:LysE family translocator [Alteromonas sp. 4B03]|uniref:LysE family translocator n=1 Tax=Alteromonas sp. 4B03 TaxID=2603817 RepID=UPI003D2AF43A